MHNYLIYNVKYGKWDMRIRGRVNVFDRNSTESSNLMFKDFIGRSSLNTYKFFI